MDSEKRQTDSESTRSVEIHREKSTHSNGEYSTSINSVESGQPELKRTLKARHLAVSFLYSTFSPWGFSSIFRY
jgi:amino acid permease